MRVYDLEGVIPENTWINVVNALGDQGTYRGISGIADYEIENAEVLSMRAVGKDKITLTIEVI